MSGQRKRIWILSTVSAIVALAVLAPFLFRHQSTSLSPITSSASTVDKPAQKDVGGGQSSDIPRSEDQVKKDLSQKNLPPPKSAPSKDGDALEFHRKMAASLNERLRDATKRQYADIFKKLNLAADLQKKVVDILTQPQAQLEQQAFDAARTGKFPVIPSPNEIAAQQAVQNQQLISALGQSGFEQLKQYQATIPDRVVIDQMNQEGANLSDGQSQRLLQVLTEARQQIVVQGSISRNLASVPPDQALPIIQQQQALLRQTVVDRSQGILTPAQATALQGALSRSNGGPKTK